MLQSRVLKLINILSSILLVWGFLGTSYAQTTLLPGDLVAVTANVSTNEIELIPLINIEQGTRIQLSGHSKDDTFDSVLFTFEKDVSQGQRITISNTESDIISATKAIDINYENGSLVFSQPDEGISRRLLGLSWGNYEIVENTSDSIDFEIPFLRFGEGLHFQYHLKNGASGTPKMLVNMLANAAHWRNSKNAFGSFQTSLRILSGPVVVFDQNISTYTEGDSIRLNVAIYEHDGSKLTVDAKLQQEYSTADTNDVDRFKNYTFNFTGLIGDAVYEKVLPISDDADFEGRETAFFELHNLSAGQFGDFVSHATFIIDNEVPNVVITANKQPKRKLPNITILNKERVFVDVNGWVIQFGVLELELENLNGIAPFEERILFLDDYLVDQTGAVFDKSAKLNVLDENRTLIGQVEIEHQKKLVRMDIAETKKNDFDLVVTDSNTEVTKQSVTTTSESVANFSSKDSSFVIEKGWRPFDLKIDLNNELEVLFWDEPRQQFRSLNLQNKDSVSGNGLIYFYEPEMNRVPDYEQFPDSTIGSSTVIEQSEWDVSISATDVNNDGYLGGSEGLNLLQNTSGKSFPVSALLNFFEDEFGGEVLNPYIFDWELGPSKVKQKSDFIHPNELFWVKADSLIEKTEFLISTEQLVLSTSEDIQFEEPISTLQLKLSNGHTSQLSDIHLFDVVYEHSKSIPNPLFDFGKNSVISSGLKFGLQSDHQWVSTLNLRYSSDAIYSIPFGAIDTVSGKLTLEIDDWNLEGGWQLFVEDSETEELTELVLGINFNFEFIQSEIGTNQENINKRYRLLMVPPGVEMFDSSIPEEINLYQNYPNPFNPATTISFYLPEPVEVSLSVFNIVGQPVATLTNGVLYAGEHHFEWNATGYPSGMYIYQLEVGTKVLTRKMTLVK